MPTTNPCMRRLLSPTPSQESFLAKKDKSEIPLPYWNDGEKMIEAVRVLFELGNIDGPECLKSNAHRKNDWSMRKGFNNPVKANM